MARTPPGIRARIVTFPTDLGWVAAIWHGSRVARLTFGHNSPLTAWQKLQVGQEPIKANWLETRIAQRLQKFAAGDRDDDFLDIDLATNDLTPFQFAITEACRHIPIGETCSYGQLAEVAGHPGAARAVGRVMATNRFPLIVPCHRVLAAGGAIGGFSAPDGISMKRRLLEPELETSRSQNACDLRLG